MFEFSNPAVFLSWLVFMPAIVALIIAFLPARGETIKRISLVATVVLFIMSLGMIFGFGDWPKFQLETAGMQHLFAYDWIPSFGIQYMMGTDGISFPLIVLTAFLSMLAMAASWPIMKHEKAYCVLFLLLVTGMLGVFAALDFFLFYVFWEVMLLPMYFLIGIWGGPRKEYAAIKFFLYTLVGSVLMLIAILMLYFNSDLTKLNAGATGSRRYRQRRPLSPSGSPNFVTQAEPVHTFNILAMQQMGQHTDLFSGEMLWRLVAAVVGVRAAVHRLRNQGAQRAAAHVVARCPRRSTDADLHDPGRRAPEDGRLRHHSHLLSDLPRGRLRAGLRRVRHRAW